MGAFKGAVEIGANAIETDVHITKDDVVVLSHDATLSRCFGQPDKIIEKDWSYISTLKTLKEPQQSMPRLQDLLEYLAQPGLEDVWLLLDIKVGLAIQYRVSARSDRPTSWTMTLTQSCDLLHRHSTESHRQPRDPGIQE